MNNIIIFCYICRIVINVFDQKLYSKLFSFTAVILASNRGILHLNDVQSTLRFLSYSFCTAVRFWPSGCYISSGQAGSVTFPPQTWVDYWWTCSRPYGASDSTPNWQAGLSPGLSLSPVRLPMNLKNHKNANRMLLWLKIQVSSLDISDIKPLLDLFVNFQVFVVLLLIFLNFSVSLWIIINCTLPLL